MADLGFSTAGTASYRHPLPVRVWHWATAAAVFGLLFTGFNILNVHPRLYALVPLIVLSGLTMSNAVTMRFPELYGLFGGRQSARTLHAMAATAMLLFIVVHIAQVFVAGAVNQMRSMITGRFVVPRQAGE